MIVLKIILLWVFSRFKSQISSVRDKSYPAHLAENITNKYNCIYNIYIHANIKINFVTFKYTGS